MALLLVLSGAATFAAETAEATQNGAAGKRSTPTPSLDKPHAVVRPAPHDASRRTSEAASRAKARTAAPSHHTQSRAATRPTTPKQKALAAKARVQHRHSDASFPADYEQTPAYRYAQLESDACIAELEQRGISARLDTNVRPGIKTPMRLEAPLNGVYFHTDILEGERNSSPYELFDCRLLLALDDFTRLLRTETIVEAVLSSAYRPNPALGDEQGRRHAGGLAVDLHRFKLEDGRWIKVEQDFHGRIGASVCGAHAAKAAPATPESALLRRLACGAADKRLFQSILTPNYDPPHRNHFHLELTVGVRWFIVS